jgi:hypothetical protein
MSLNCITPYGKEHKMNKQMLLSSAAGAGLMAVSLGASAASFGQAGVFASTVNPTYYAALLPSGETASDATLLLEVNTNASGLNFSYVAPLAANNYAASVGGTVDSASAVIRVYSVSLGASVPYTATSAIAYPSVSYAIGTTSAMQAYSNQTVLPITGTSAGTNNRVTCDVIFHAQLDVNNFLSYKVLAARPARWAVPAADVTVTSASGTATGTYTVASAFWQGGFAATAIASITNAACSTNSSFTGSVTQLKTFASLPASYISGTATVTSALASWSSPVYNTSEKIVNALLACVNYGIARNALTGTALTKVW